MKRILIYSFLFCVSLIVMCATIYAMNVAFWISLSVFALSCCLMARDHKMLEGEIEDLDNMF